MRPRAPGQPGDKWEKRGRQVQNHVAQGTQSQKQVGDKRGTNAESCGPKHPQTSGIQVQNYAAQSIHSVLRDSGGQVGDKGNKFRFSYPDHLERIWERSVGSCGPEHLQHTGR